MATTSFIDPIKGHERDSVRPLTRGPSSGSRPSLGPARTSSPHAASTGHDTSYSSPEKTEKEEANESLKRM